MKRQELNVRDPFVLADAASGQYYLYSTTGQECWGGPASGFYAYRSPDLEAWEGPFQVFAPPEGFWSDINYWAPEVHAYGGAYYMLATFYCTDRHRRRGTQVLRADSPLGPFRVWSDGPVTPEAWECLDGTLYVEDGQPYLVFCHEWLQAVDGTICALPLTPDLKAAAGAPTVLFHASEAPWSTGSDFAFPDGHREVAHVTDGPYLFRSPQGGLCMLWSSFQEGRYAIGVAHSAGGVLGPWTQEAQSIFREDGGHGMVLNTLGGQQRLCIHSPNTAGEERPLFLSVRWEGEQLVV